MSNSRIFIQIYIHVELRNTICETENVQQTIQNYVKSDGQLRTFWMDLIFRLVNFLVNCPKVHQFECKIHQICHKPVNFRTGRFQFHKYGISTSRVNTRINPTQNIHNYLLHNNSVLTSAIFHGLVHQSIILFLATPMNFATSFNATVHI